MPNDGPPPPSEPRDEVAEEAVEWATNRAAYPGWVVAPEQTRYHLSEHTLRWIGPIVASAPTRPPLEALRLLDELNWRLEVALLPLYDNVADVVEQSLHAIYPFPGKPDIPEPPPAVTFDGSSLPLHEWEKHRRRWLDLSFALLRFHREERHHQRFDELASRLRPRVLTSPSLYARWSYERCLFALARMDDASARQALSEWPIDDDDPAWTIRRAAILAELGEVTEAQRIAEDALRRIRSSSHGPAHIPSVSREGWAMLLVNALETSSCLERGQTLPESRGRFEALERLRCNPWEAFRRLTDLLDSAPPRPKSQNQRHSGFSLGSVFDAYSSGVGRELPPAYQFSRLAEEGPFPPKVGRVGYSGKTLSRVSEWLANDDPVRSHSLACRLLNSELIEQYFVLHRVATLSVDVVSDLVECCRSALDQAEPVAGGSLFGPDAAVVRHRATDRLDAAVLLLSRLIPRIPSEQAARFLPRVLLLFQSEAVRKSLSRPEKIGALLKAALSAMTPADISASLLHLVQLPIPGSPELPVIHPEQWPIVPTLLPDRIDPPSRDAAPDAWAGRVRSLVALLRVAPFLVRGTVAMLLQRISDMGCLDTEERTRFADALWAMRDEVSGLPSVYPYHRSVLLKLPEPTPGLADSAVHAYLRRSDIARFRTRSRGADGKESTSFVMLAGPDEFLTDWRHAAPAIPRRADGPRSITPSGSDLTVLIQKIRAWWDEEGRPLLTDKRPASPAFGPIKESIRQRCLEILDVIRDVVMSRTPKGQRGAALATQSLALVEEFQQVDVATHAIQPAILHFRPATEAEVESQLVAGLVSSQESEYIQAIRGLLFWLETQLPRSRRPRGFDLPPPPAHLLQQLGINIAARRQPGLFDSLRAASFVCSDVPTLATPPFLSSVVLGLRYLFSEASYRDRSDSDGLIPYLQVPSYRVVIARLAYAISRIIPAETIVTQWLAAAVADPLPEVRAAAQGD